MSHSCRTALLRAVAYRWFSLVFAAGVCDMKKAPEDV
jgi:hypothetical protein